MTASLVRRYNDFDLAEDCSQDALVQALATWPRDGLPARPGAWLMRVAHRKALDQLRRRRVLERKLGGSGWPARGGGDDRLLLMFVCCHPALSREAQLALTLRTVAGLTTQQIAGAFLTSPATVAQRIVRAKRKIASARIPYRMPAPADLDERVGEVLAVLYGIYNEGYLSHTWEAAHFPRLVEEATWLAGLLASLLPRHAETLGLLALFRLHRARSAGRFSADGRLVLLADQDRSRWDREEILAATALLERAAGLGPPGQYQLQAAIAACHAEAGSWEETDWVMVLRLYDRLARVAPSPVVRLNRAVAVWHLRGPGAALAEVDSLPAEMERYHLFQSLRGELLRELGREGEAQLTFGRAAELTVNPAERSHLRRRRHPEGEGTG